MARHSGRRPKPNRSLHRAATHSRSRSVRRKPAYRAGAALALGMIVITALANVVYLVIRTRAERWLK